MARAKDEKRAFAVILCTRLLLTTSNANLKGKNMDRIVPPYLEWEALREPITISKVDDIPEIPKGEKKITINRDEDYNLRATLCFGDLAFGKVLRQSSAVAGSIHEGFDVQGSRFESIFYTLESCLIGTTTFNIVLEGQDSQMHTAILNFRGLGIKHKNEKEGTHRTEWYLNGPNEDVFCRDTDRRISSRFFRDRFAKEDKIDSIEISRDSQSSGVDFLRINVGDLQFLVSRVPHGLGPSWSSNIGIEYRKKWGRIPDTQERENIEELCSFIFGRQLLSVGYTIYDQDENMVEGHVHHPWGRNARSFCSKPDKPPIRINHSAKGRAEEAISQLLPVYCELSKPLRLKEALWNYWVSRDTPIGTNLSMLAAALESTINGWFEYKSESHGVYLGKKEFVALLREEIEAIKRKLESIGNKPYADGILNKIMNANIIGIMERYRIFFEEIELPIDSSEWEAIKERHKFVHGHILLDEANWKRVIQHVDTFETLLHKTLLKLLGYSGAFVDRSVPGWSEKQLS
jgi:hypothetical protein